MEKSIPLFDATVGVFERGLNGLSVMREKAVAFSAERGLAEPDVLNWRLYPDMFPLYRQFQIVCDFAVLAPARVVGGDVPDALSGAPDFAELERNIAHAKHVLSEFTPEQFDGRQDEPVTFPVGDLEMTLPAHQYVLGFATQNYFFHLVTAYSILRSMGVPLGKRAYFGQSD